MNDQVTRCPALDLRLGLRAIVAALAHLVASRGHAACMYERVAVAAIAAVVEMRADLQSMASSLTTAVELLEEAAERRDTQTTWPSGPEERKGNTWN